MMTKLLPTVLVIYVLLCVVSSSYLTTEPLCCLHLDVYHLVDASNSLHMSDWNARETLKEVIQNIKDSHPLMRFAFGRYGDIPVSSFGDPNGFCYEHVANFSLVSDDDAMASALDSLTREIATGPLQYEEETVFTAMWNTLIGMPPPEKNRARVLSLIAIAEERSFFYAAEEDALDNWTFTDRPTLETREPAQCDAVKKTLSEFPTAEQITDFLRTAEIAYIHSEYNDGTHSVHFPELNTYVLGYRIPNTWSSFSSFSDLGQQLTQDLIEMEAFLSPPDCVDCSDFSTEPPLSSTSATDFRVIEEYPEIKDILMSAGLDPYEMEDLWEQKNYREVFNLINTHIGLEPILQAWLLKGATPVHSSLVLASLIVGVTSLVTFILMAIGCFIVYHSKRYREDDLDDDVCFEHDGDDSLRLEDCEVGVTIIKKEGRGLASNSASTQAAISFDPGIASTSAFDSIT